MQGPSKCLLPSQPICHRYTKWCWNHGKNRPLIFGSTSRALSCPCWRQKCIQLLGQKQTFASPWREFSKRLFHHQVLVCQPHQNYRRWRRLRSHLHRQLHWKPTRLHLWDFRLELSHPPTTTKQLLFVFNPSLLRRSFDIRTSFWCIQRLNTLEKVICHSHGRRITR